MGRVVRARGLKTRLELEFLFAFHDKRGDFFRCDTKAISDFTLKLFILFRYLEKVCNNIISSLNRIGIVSYFYDVILNLFTKIRY